MPFFILEFSISKITSHQFQVNNNEGEQGTVYYMIIVANLMVELILIADFKLHVLEWDGNVIPIKSPVHNPGKPHF